MEGNFCTDYMAKMGMEADSGANVVDFEIRSTRVGSILFYVRS